MSAWENQVLKGKEEKGSTKVSVWAKNSITFYSCEEESTAIKEGWNEKRNLSSLPFSNYKASVKTQKKNVLNRPLLRQTKSTIEMGTSDSWASYPLSYMKRGAVGCYVVCGKMGQHNKRILNPPDNICGADIFRQRATCLPQSLCRPHRRRRRRRRESPETSQGSRTSTRLHSPGSGMVTIT